MVDLNKIILWLVVLLVVTSTVALAKQIKEPIKDKSIQKGIYLGKLTEKNPKIKDIKLDQKAKFEVKNKEVMINSVEIDGRWITQITTQNKFYKEEQK